MTEEKSSNEECQLGPLIAGTAVIVTYNPDCNIAMSEIPEAPEIGPGICILYPGKAKIFLPIQTAEAVAFFLMHDVFGNELDDVGKFMTQHARDAN